jgi:hypothetical protein
MIGSAVTAATTAAVNAAGSPMVAVAYLLLVVSLTAVSYLFLQPNGNRVGAHERLADVRTPLPRAVSHPANSSAEDTYRRSPSFQRLAEDPESAVSSGCREPIMHGIIAHTPSTVRDPAKALAMFNQIGFPVLLASFFGC